MAMNSYLHDRCNERPNQRVVSRSEPIELKRLGIPNPVHKQCRQAQFYSPATDGLASKARFIPVPTTKLAFFSVNESNRLFDSDIFARKQDIVDHAAPPG